MTIKSADNLIVAMEAEKLGKPIPAPIQTQPDTKEADVVETVKEVVQEAPKELDKSQELQKETPTLKETSDEKPIDEYGNEITTKERLYTQEEVNRIMRDRAAREQHAKKLAEQEAVTTNAPDVSNTDDDATWEQQLSQHIDQRINTRLQQDQQKVWEAEQQREQQIYEEKFTSSVRKYTDFESVVQDKPITTSMMLATKSMDDPAAFIYAACKQHPKELERIAQIKDPYAQIAEVARLEERMRRPKKVTNAPAPSEKVTGDQTDSAPKHSIDSLIAQHAKEKIMNNRSWK